ncbi:MULTISPECIES: MarR family transcriptional regulator [Clostridium]|uniref:MarR family transcriptional regulator n=1 Tax=Clostridium aquiflavi TaxID=3073603 RepID=A0ABU1EEL7_9CLOT|nr:MULTISPECIES: MarR family transcriptional regulator [unclassified Clostridium]MDR5586805.1 MarR family transcriptional regulator [Clostridium sp. 5N-1]NFG62626.1 MarR family transcriptional regulator [Clostridium botulinum]NFQ10012.1 MarR family transcriptional regulator [Clostridium botulinum]
MNQSKKIVNQILVELFNDILQIEEQTIKEGVISDLSITEIHTIEAIGMYKKRTMSEVAQDLKITVGTLTTAINKLIKKGYVERSRIEEDRRVVLIALTKKGKLAYRLHEKFHNDMVSNSIESLTQQEEAMLISALNKINEFLREKYKLK